MEKTSDGPVCFVARLEEVRRYGLSPLGQLKKNPEAKLLFSKKEKEVRSLFKKDKSD